MKPVLDTSRLQDDLDALARIGGRPDGGVTRLAFSEEDRKGRDFVQTLLGELGLTSRFDALGNLVAIQDGFDPGAGIVLAGSHTDTVGAGGRFDGALGVLAAIAAIRAIQQAGMTTRRSVGVVSFVNEEGVRFMPDMMGSLFVRGGLSVRDAHEAIGIDGARLESELNRHGMAGPSDFRGLPVSAFVELHIEQGSILEASGSPIGVVTGVQGLRWLRLTVSGAANHAGTTPMAGRKDAGQSAFRIASSVGSLGNEVAGLRSTIGRIELEPNLVNVIPGKATFTIDLRHPVQERLDEAERIVSDLVTREAERSGLQITTEVLAAVAPVVFSPEVVGAVQSAASVNGYAYERLVSGAGHDAQIMSAVWPSGMIFIPSRDGISHNPLEYSSPEDIEAGATVLLDAVVSLANAG